MSTIHERLKAARIKAGFGSATEAADAFRWKKSTYMGHENGDRSPRRTTAERYATAFRTTPGYLLFGTKPGATPHGLDPDRTAQVISALLRMVRDDIAEEDADLLAKLSVALAQQPANQPDEPSDRLRLQIQAQFGARKLKSP
jgi:DNA-binding XRE family transcriptional regulator